MLPVAAPQVSRSILRPCRPEIDDDASIRFRWNRMKSAHYSPGIAIIEDLPKPVKNACVALPSAVLSDNVVKAD
jgi:hypothetical protein